MIENILETILESDQVRQASGLLFTSVIKQDIAGALRWHMMGNELVGKRGANTSRQLI